MKLHFVRPAETDLAEPDPAVLDAVRSAMLALRPCEETDSIDAADALVMHERYSYKEWRYIDRLHACPIASRHPEKLYVINTDDGATGLLRGLYTSLPRLKFDRAIHRAIPYARFPNEFVVAPPAATDVAPVLLASWRGNPKSHRIRPRMLARYRSDPRIVLESTESWMNHGIDEKIDYVRLIRSAKFSLCPAGWAPVSFRIYESMALGRCPVLLADDFVRPEGPDWNAFALFVPEKDYGRLDEILGAVEATHEFRGRKAREAWERFFGTDTVWGYYAQAMFSCITGAPRGSQDGEFRRWRSLRTYRANGWTVPQRVVSRLKRLAVPK